MRTDEPRPLSEPLRLRGRTLRGRIVFCAHLTNLAAGGMPSAEHAAYYEARARGGASLIITEEHTVHPSDRPYEKLIRGYDPAVLGGYRRITGRVHAQGAVVLAQLNHNGAQGTSAYTRRPLLAPSAVFDPMFKEVPKPLERVEIDGIVGGFADTARRCRDGGFDGVEIQASQASLIRQFLARATNRRSDEYGGGLGNRARFLLDVLAAVRGAVGPDLIVGVRLAGEEHVDGGIGLDEAVATARLIEATGAADYLNTSIGMATRTLHLIEASMATAPGYALHIPRALRAAVDLPVVGVGRFTDPSEAEAALRDGACDLVGVVRGQIADPGFADAAVSQRSAPARTCSGCNQECIGRVGFNLPIRCLQNPSAGREDAAGTSVRVRRGRRIAVVGGGPAGLQAAAVAAERGHRVTVFERDSAVGGQIALAARAPRRGGLAAITQDLVRRCRAAGVALEPDAPIAARDLLASAPDAVVLATGARPDPPAWSRGLSGALFSDVRDVLAHRSRPTGRVLVIDGLGFHPATSAAELLAARGCVVTVCTDAMVVGQDLGVTLDREGWMVRAYAAGIATRTDTLVASAVVQGGCLRLRMVRHTTGEQYDEEYGHVVYAGQQRCEDALWRELKTAASPFPVHRIGDALAPRRADAAIREGGRLGASL